MNGHIETLYSTRTSTWSTPEFVTSPYLQIHGLAPGLNYGQQAYEGLKAFRTPTSTIQIFRPSLNAARLAHSATFISCPSPPPELFLQCVHLAVSLNAAYVPPHPTGAALYIRPLLFGSSAQLGLSPPDEYTFAVYVLPVGVYHGTSAVDALVLEDFDRAAPDGTGSAKIGGNYAPVLRHSEQARADGFGITLHLDSKTRTVVDEFSTSGFLAIRSSPTAGTTLVVPDSPSVIASVTSASCCELAASFGWKVERRPVPYAELKDFSEVMAAGTAAGLVPIKSITCRGKGEKFTYQEGRAEAGPACAKLLETLRGIQRGIVEDGFGWCETAKDAKELGAYTSRGKGEGEGKEAVEGSVDRLP